MTPREITDSDLQYWADYAPRAVTYAADDPETAPCPAIVTGVPDPYGVIGRTVVRVPWVLDEIELARPRQGRHAMALDLGWSPASHARSVGAQPMTRRMSCSLTIDAVRARTKTVTRRRVDTWKTLQPLDRLTLIDKGMGLPAGAHQVVLADVEIVAVTVERLSDAHDTAAEGFPELTPAEFQAMWLESHGYPPDTPPHLTPVRRIEWRYLR